MGLFTKKIKYCSNFDLIQHGNCIDIPMNKFTCSEEQVKKKLFKHIMIPLGFRTELPKYHRATLLPRSSTAKNYGLDVITGEIEADYGGIWCASAFVHANDVTIPSGARIVQFTLDLVFDAPWYVRLMRPFFKYKFERVDVIDSMRAGLGSTGL